MLKSGEMEKLCSERSRFHWFIKLVKELSKAANVPRNKKKRVLNNHMHECCAEVIKRKGKRKMTYLLA